MGSLNKRRLLRFVLIMNNLILSKSNTLKLPLFINWGTEKSPIQYELQPTDTIYVGVMENNQSFENAIIRKLYKYNDEKDEYGNLIIKITPEDTEYLLPGKYCLTIKLRRQLIDTYEVHTVINNISLQIIN